MLKTLKLCCNVALVKRYLPYVDTIFLTNVYALISSVEWLDFYNDSEGLLMSFISQSLLLLCNLSFMYADFKHC